MKFDFKKFLKYGVTPLFLFILLYSVYTTQFTYWIASYSRVTEDVIPVSYELQAKSATTTALLFGEVQFMVPWPSSALTFSKIHPSIASWVFDNGQNSLVATLSTTTTQVVWAQQAGIEKVVPNINSLNTYEVERMVWNVRRDELPLWATKNNDAVKNMLLVGIKAVKYSWCDTLLEFQNTNDVRGVLCESIDEKGVPLSDVYFYLSNDDTEYQLHIKTSQSKVRDSIVASIKKQQ